MKARTFFSALTCFAWGISANPASQQGISSANRSPILSFHDADQDGVADSLELLLGMNSQLPDSDNDGFSDAEEFARHSSPLQASSTPNPLESPPDKIAVGLWADEPAKGYIRLNQFVYLPQGMQPNLTATLVRLLPDANFDYAATTPVSLTSLTAFVPGNAPGSKVGLLTKLLPTTWNSQLSLTGYLSLACVVDNNGTGLGVAANARLLHAVFHSTGTPYYFQRSTTAPVTELAPMQSGGALFRPLYPESPSSWEEGKLCTQNTVLVGYSGGAAVQEVVSASCEEGWDGYCAPNCSASVGTTITTIDPAVLVGG